MPRVRPRGSIEFHAHAVEEAIHLEDEPIAIQVVGRCSTGEAHAAMAYVPQAFPYLLMKLHAFDDRKEEVDKDLGRHHALDLYTIVGMMTEKEYERPRNSVPPTRPMRTSDGQALSCGIIFQARPSVLLSLVHRGRIARWSRGTTRARQRWASSVSRSIRCSAMNSNWRIS
jgi:hypothetical protein